MDYAELSNYEGLEEEEEEVEEEGNGVPAHPLDSWSDENQGTPPRSATSRLGGFGRRFAKKLTQAVTNLGANTVVLGDAMGRSALSAGELVGDSELRKKGADVVITGARATIQDLKRSIYSGASSVQRGITRGFQPISNAPKSVQSVLSRVQHRIHQQRLRILLRAAKDDPVDVQIGPQLYEDAPQELRSRLWCALVMNPGIGMAAYSKSDVPVPENIPASTIAAMCRQTDEDGATAAVSGDGSEYGSAVGSDGDSSQANTSARFGEPHVTSEDLPPAVAQVEPGLLQEGEDGAARTMPVLSRASTELECGSAERTRKQVGEEGCSGSAAREEPVSVELIVVRDDDVRVLINTWDALGAASEAGASSEADGEEDITQLYKQMCLSARQHNTGDVVTSLLAPVPPSHGRHAGVRSDNPMYRIPSTPHSLGWEDVGDTFLGEWEMVTHWTDSTGQQRPRPPADSGSSFSNGLSAEENQELRRKLGGLLRAMWEIEWPIPTAIPEECRYSTLLQISVGQEDVDEVITRDIHRTFPEHPQFGLEDVGQAALFNVLKAYSLHDLEVGYCQGMAFVAGVLLMYLPEEPAFQAFCALMDGNGPDLRNFYLPGLEGLKFYLALFEELLVQLHPAIAKHLQEHGIPPMLYASQWFLTAFACPFPTTFASRVIDVMLAEHHGEMLMRTALAVMAECEPEIVELDDFEDIITHLKVEPCHWGTERTRTVLNNAVHGSFSEQQMADAKAAVKASQDSVNMCRAPSRISLADPQPGTTSAPESGEGSRAGRGTRLSAVDQMVRERSRGEVCSPESEGLPGDDPADEDLQAQLEAQEEDMKKDMMALVLAMDMDMDMTLDGGSGRGGGAS